MRRGRDEQCFYVIGDADGRGAAEAPLNDRRAFFWLWDDGRIEGYGGATRAEALASAREAAAGQPVHLWGRVRLNDYVGSPIWGQYVDYGEIPTEQEHTP